MSNSSLSRSLWWVSPVLGAAMMVALFVLGFHWTFNRIYVPIGKSLVLTYKGPYLLGRSARAQPGQLARVNKDGVQEVGVLAEMKGPGRHFYCPIWWRMELVEDVVVEPGSVAIFASSIGDPPVAGAAATDSGQFLVEGELGATTRQGTLRRIYGPGRYRVNPYAYKWEIIKELEIKSGTQVKHAGWVKVPTGYVGVVTNQADDPKLKVRKGVQQDVLQPGIYPLNPKAQLVDIVEIGFREKSIVTDEQVDAKGNVLTDPISGEPIISEGSTGISFPSRDGFKIHMDFTAIWGIMPEQAAEMIRLLGSVEAVEQRVVVPQIESICRNEGSKLGAVDLLVGESRQKFQEATAEEFKKKLSNNGVSLLYGLVRYIYIPQEIRQPIQQAFIADELKVTREQEQLTAKTEGNLREAEQKVLLETGRITAETTKKVATLKAEGDKTAAETRGETVKLLAEIDKLTAEAESEAKVLKGKAESMAKQVLAEAKSEKFKLAVAAFGSGDAYNQWVFASGLPEDIQINMLYAGEGTFWTDLKGFTDVMLSRQAAQQQQPKPSGTVRPAVKK